MPRTFLLEVPALLLLVTTGSACGRHTPEPENRPSPVASAFSPPAPVLQAPSASSPRAEPSAARVVWSDPPTWTRTGQPSPMRLATYRVPRAANDKEDAELAVFHFGGGQGGAVEANLSRWEKQFSDVAPAATRRSERTVNGLRAHILEIDSGTYTAMAMTPGQEGGPKTAYGLLAAVVETPLGSYFFKLTGPAKTIKAERDAYMTLLDSVKVQS